YRVSPNCVVRFLCLGKNDDHLDPLSFPTRRSSDLIIDGAGDTVGNYSFRLLDVGAAPALPLDTDLVGSINPGRSVVLYQLAGTRSEEQTFELKSRDNVACRILYEKNDAAVPGGSYI